MAEDLFFRKGTGVMIIPVDDSGVDYVKRLKPGEIIKVTPVKPRNLKFHRKFFSMINFAFDYWEPAEITIRNGKSFKAVRMFARFICDAHPYLHTVIKSCLNEFGKAFTESRFTPEKNLDQFRADVTILAGYYSTNFRLDGSVQVVAKSISFAKMTEKEFESLYKSVFNVLWTHVMSKVEGFTEQELEHCLLQLMAYD